MLWGRRSKPSMRMGRTTPRRLRRCCRAVHMRSCTVHGIRRDGASGCQLYTCHRIDQKGVDAIHTQPHGFVAKYTILIFLTLVLSKDTYCIIIQYTVCQLLFIVNFRMYNVMSMSKGKEILLKHTMQLVCCAGPTQGRPK